MEQGTAQAFAAAAHGRTGRMRFFPTAFRVRCERDLVPRFVVRRRLKIAKVVIVRLC